MPDSANPVLAREGWIHVGLAVAAAIAATVWAGGWLALLLWGIAIFMIQFFRDPPRDIPTEPNLAVCPADGKVVYAGDARDPYLDRQAFKVSIFMNVFSVHSNRIPVSGTVRDQWYRHGRFINAVLDKASEENERNVLWLQSDSIGDVVCVQVAGLIARRILCYVGIGDRVRRGQRYGFIRFGSRVDVFLPQGFEPAVRLGDNVKAGSVVLGRFAS